jgi:integrase
MAGRRGFGHLRKLPSGHYQASYKHEGVRHTGPHTFEFKADADTYLAGVQTKIRSGEWIDPNEGKVLFRVYAEQWRSSQVHRDSTAAQIETHLRNHVYPVVGERAMVSIRSSDIQALVKQLSVGGDGRKALSPATVQVIYTWVSTIFTAAVNDRIISATPCIKIKRPSVDKKRIEPASVETIWKLINAVPDRYRALVALGAGTGVRISEALGLTNDRVDWLRRTVTIDRQLLRIGAASSTVFGEVKDKNNRPRLIPLPDLVVEELSTHVRQFGLGPEGLIFTGPKGGPIRRSTFSDVWRNAADPLGFSKGEGFHQLRHFYASLLIESGQSVKTIQDRLGHHSAVITLDVYGHLWPEGEDLTRAAVDKAFEGLVARM